MKIIDYVNISNYLIYHKFDDSKHIAPMKLIFSLVHNRVVAIINCYQFVEITV